MSWEKVNFNNFSWYYHTKESNLELFKKFIIENDIVSFRKSKTYTSFKRFLETGRDAGKYPVNDMLEYPYKDHDYYFKTKHGKVIYISQPYSDYESTKKEYDNFSNNLDIKCVVYDSNFSWYSPGHSLLVIVTLNDINVKVFKG